MKTKLGFATLALGSFLTLLGPAAAMAQGRDDFRQNDNHGYTTSFRNRETPREKELRLRLELERLERERLAKQRWNRDHRFNNNYGNQGGYYDRNDSGRR
ncbi:MAG: hypothetical protein ABJF23_31875 [Bryobacteraceae bacterium]